MPFSFLMMSMAAAGALAAALAVIPLIVHMLHRQKVTPVAWGAMQFLLESRLRVKRRRKIDHWVLMLLRMAILVLVVLLLCRPVWKTSAMATSTPVDVAVVIDHSMTMGTRQGAGSAGTLFDQGVAIAERLANMLPPSGTMSIVLAEHAPRIMTPTPLKMGLTDRAADGTPRGEWARQLKVLRDLAPGMTRGDIPAGVEAARELLSHGYNTRKIIFVISDDQRTNWDPGDEKAWTAAVGHGQLAPEQAAAAIPVFSVPVKPSGAAGQDNVTVRGVLVLPEFLGLHRPAQIVATIANSGARDLHNVPLVLEVDGKRVMSRTLASLGVGESSSVRFDYYFPEAGSHWVRVRADVVDALDADNAATAAVNVKARLPVLVVDGQLTPDAGGRGLNAFPQAGFLLAAMQPVDPAIDPVTLIDPTVISVAELATPKGVRLEDYPIVVLNDVPRLTREWVDRLAAHAQAGNGVWMILGPRTEAGFINDVLAKSTLLPMTTQGIARAPAPVPGEAQSHWVTIDIKEPANRAVSILTQGGESEHSALADVTLHAWWNVTPVVPGMRTVLATTTGAPLVLEMDMGKLGGRAVVWTSPAGDMRWNNLPLVPNFVPLVNETLFNLAGGQEARQPRQVEAGQPLTWTGGGGNQVLESVQLLRPDGSAHPLLPEVRGDHYFVEERDTALPGLYEMRFSAPARAGATVPPAVYFSVNIDGDELDPATLAPEDFAWYREHSYLAGIVAPADGPAATAALAQALQATHGGRDLWPWLGLVVLALLVLEVLVTYFRVRQQAGKSLEDEGLGAVLPRGTLREGAP